MPDLPKLSGTLDLIKLETFHIYGVVWESLGNFVVFLFNLASQVEVELWLGLEKEKERIVAGSVEELEVKGPVWENSL